MVQPIATVAEVPPTTSPAIAPQVDRPRHQTPSMISGAKVAAATANASPTVVASPSGSVARLTP